MAHEHWQYFLALETDLDAITRYVELCPANYGTYSIELAKLLLAVCSEVDVVARLLCREVDPAAPAANIDDYRTTIGANYPLFHTIQVLIPRFSLEFRPWSDWGSGVNPGWWREHNDVKHFRYDNYPRANLGNCLGALTGLFALVLYLYHKDLLAVRLEPEQKLLALPKQPDTLIEGKYELPDFR